MQYEIFAIYLCLASIALKIIRNDFFDKGGSGAFICAFLSGMMLAISFVIIIACAISGGEVPE